MKMKLFSSSTKFLSPFFNLRDGFFLSTQSDERPKCYSFIQRQMFRHQCDNGATLRRHIYIIIHRNQINLATKMWLVISSTKFSFGTSNLKLNLLSVCESDEQSRTPFSITRRHCVHLNESNQHNKSE